MITLSNFPNSSETPNSSTDPASEESVPVGPAVIRNYPLVVLTVNDAFAKDPERTALLLTSNGNEEEPATEYYLRRVVN